VFRILNEIGDFADAVKAKGLVIFIKRIVCSGESFTKKLKRIAKKETSV
jgi:hypothetical protein